MVGGNQGPLPRAIAVQWSRGPDIISYERFYFLTIFVCGLLQLSNDVGMSVRMSIHMNIRSEIQQFPSDLRWWRDAMTEQWKTGEE